MLRLLSSSVRVADAVRRGWWLHSMEQAMVRHARRLDLILEIP